MVTASSNSNSSSPTVAPAVNTNAILSALQNGVVAINNLNNAVARATSTATLPLSVQFDAAFGSTQGDILYRSSNVWTVLTPGTSGQFLITGGAAANPQWQTLSVIQIIPTTNWYVASTGSDSSNTGQSVGSPFLTIQHAVNVIFGYDWQQQSVTINVAAGTFAAFSAVGLGRGYGGNTGGSNLIILGAGSTSTSISAGSLTRNCNVLAEGVTLLCTAANAGMSVDVGGNFYIGTDVTFSGNSSSAQALSVDAFGTVLQNANIKLAGTLQVYFYGFNTANYELLSGNITITAALGSLAILDVGSNMHNLGSPTISFSGGGSATSNAYQVSGNSVISNFGTLDTTWSAAGGDTGLLLSGGRSESSVTAPSITATTGLGSGSAALATGSNAYALVIILSPTGSPSASGTVTVRVNEYPVTSGLTVCYGATVMDDSGTWQGRSIAQLGAITTHTADFTMVVKWDNNGVNLSAGSTYQINVTAQT